MFIRPRVIALAATVVMAAVAPGVSVAAAPPVPWGTVLVHGQTWAGVVGRWGDVNVYSNGSGRQDGQGMYGPTYECTELAERWAAIRYGVNPNSWHIAFAYQMFDAAPLLPRPFEALPNGGVDGPAPGDILVFDRTASNGTGHVAVVAGTGRGHVDIVEQNWGNPKPTGTARLPISGTTMPARWGLPIRGWIRPSVHPFVRTLYRELLGRAADPAGLASWGAAVDHGANRSAMAVTLMNSNEGRAQLVRHSYASVMRRAADAGGVAYWSEYLARHSVQDLEASLMATSEYSRRQGGGTETGFVNAMYRDALGRPPDRSGRTFALKQLAGGATHAQVAFTALTSQEGERHRVTVMYATYLHRAGDAGGVAYKAGLLQQGRSMQQVAADMLGSGEYAARFRVL